MFLPVFIMMNCLSFIFERCLICFIANNFEIQSKL
jgi:hypothetical protein